MQRRRRRNVRKLRPSADDAKTHVGRDRAGIGRTLQLLRVPVRPVRSAGAADGVRRNNNGRTAGHDGAEAGHTPRGFVRHGTGHWAALPGLCRWLHEEVESNEKDAEEEEQQWIVGHQQQR